MSPSGDPLTCRIVPSGRAARRVRSRKEATKSPYSHDTILTRRPIIVLGSSVVIDRSARRGGHVARPALEKIVPPSREVKPWGGRHRERAAASKSLQGQP